MSNPVNYINPKRRVSAQGKDLTEKVVHINRVAKVVKGGRRFNFSAVVVVGDGQGNVGVGLGKAHEVPDAIRKGANIARRSLVRVPLKGHSIPHPIRVRLAAAQVFLRPTGNGAGLIAGGSARVVLEMAGVTDVSAKSLGSSNALNLAKATIYALSHLHDSEEIAKRTHQGVRS